MAVYAAIAAVWFTGNYVRPLAEPDEGRYAEIPREMLTGGDWIVPHLNGMQYLEKPPLQYWATAASYAMFGVSPWSSRLCNTVLGLLGVVVVFAMGRAIFGAAAGEYAALILASSPLYVTIAQINLLDMGLAFFLTVAVATFLWSQRPLLTHLAQRRWMWLCWASLGLGFLQKGLVAFALPGLALAMYSVMQRDAAVWRRLHWRAGLLIVLLLDLPWIAAISAKNHEFMEFFFIREHVLRYLTTMHGRAQPWWFFSAMLVVGLLPWLLPITLGTVRAWRARTPPGSFNPSRFLVIWAGTILLFFSASGSQLAPYVVPIVAPLALLGGDALANLAIRRRTIFLCALPVAMALACAVSPLIVLTAMKPGVQQVAFTNFSRAALICAALVAPTIALAPLALGGSIRAVATPDSRLRLAVTVLALGLSAGMVALTTGTRSLEPLAGGPSIANAIGPYMRPDTPFYCVGRYLQTVTFTLARTCILVGTPGELLTQFDDGEKNWIPTISEFEDRWRTQPGAIAVIDPGLWLALRAAGLPMHVLFRSGAAVAVRNNL